MKNPLKNKPASNVMGRQEAAVWLGRAMSTNEVNLRVTMQLLDVIDFQQRLIQALYEKIAPIPGNGQPPASVFLEVDQGATKGILDKLTEWRSELDPVLKVVDDACRKLEGML
jgi:hypothetical protein